MSKIDLGSNNLRQLGKLRPVVKGDTIKLLGTKVVIVSCKALRQVPT